MMGEGRGSSRGWAVILGALLCAPAMAGDLRSYLTGELAGLEVVEDTVSLAGHVITYSDGTDHALAEKKGKVLLVNLWAKWCAPCRAEMKDFGRLQEDLGDDRFEVVALPMKYMTATSARKILTKWGAESLEPYVQEPRDLARLLHEQGLAEGGAVSFSLPTTYLVGKDGRVLAMREGFLSWDTPEARALITALKEDAVAAPPVQPAE